MQARNRNQSSRLIGDTFPLHFLLSIKLSRVIRSRSQWRLQENLLNLKVFLSSPLGLARFFPNLSSRAITRVFFSSPHHRLFKKTENFKIFGRVSNLVFIVLWVYDWKGHHGFHGFCEMAFLTIFKATEHLGRTWQYRGHPYVFPESPKLRYYTRDLFWLSPTPQHHVIHHVKNHTHHPSIMDQSLTRSVLRLATVLLRYRLADSPHACVPLQNVILSCCQ
jgi:hypothetical protein